MTEKLPDTVTEPQDFGLSEYDREIIDLLVWRKYRFSYVEAQRGARLKLLVDAQRQVDAKLTERKMMNILRNPAAKRYARKQKEDLRALAMRRLKDSIPEVVDDYHWARQAAREAGDYREVRVGAADHLDRVGASEKAPTVAVQVANITLHSRNFTSENLLAESPQLEGEVVQPPDGPAE